MLRGFSAPVRLRFEPPLDDEGLAFLAAHDTDEFNRWEAGQELGARVVLAAAARFAAAAAAGDDAPGIELPAPFVAAFRATLADATLDPSLRAYALELPSLAELADRMDVIDPAALPAARRAARRALAAACEAELAALYDALAPPAGAAFSVDGAAIGRRRLRNCALRYLCALDDATPAGAAATARAREQARDPRRARARSRRAPPRSLGGDDADAARLCLPVSHSPV